MPDPKQITIPGYDANASGVLTGATLTYDMSNGPGSPITVYAFKKMVKSYINNATTIGDTNRTAVVDFCKESILRVLGQCGCEGIRFWFVIPVDGKGVSLALQGLDEHGYPLKKDCVEIDFSQTVVPPEQHKGSNPKLEEKGNGLSVSEIIKQNKAKAEFLGFNNLQIIQEALAKEWKS